MTDQLISIDAESNGLAGRAFAVALTLTDTSGELAIPENCPGGYPQLLAEIHSTYLDWGGRAVPLIAHVAWPVEARLLLDVFPGSDIWAGPYPLIDVASVLLAKGHDPLTVDGYLDAHGIDRPAGSPHHPLYDARAAARCHRHLMTTTGSAT